MNNFLRKEIKLCMSPINYVFLLFVLMTLVPSYPCYVEFIYLELSVFYIFNTGLINKDLQYSMILPIKKSDIVKSRCILVAVYEVVFYVLTIPLSILRYTAFNIINKGGIEFNVAFYGLCLIIMTIFNYVFFTLYYKKANKPGFPFLIAGLIFLVLYVLCELPIWLGPSLNIEYFMVMDRVDGASLVKQLPILAVGLLVYVFGWILTYKKSAKLFEKVDL